jgi:hypothetical protein
VLGSVLWVFGVWVSCWCLVLGVRGGGSASSFRWLVHHSSLAGWLARTQHIHVLFFALFARENVDQRQRLRSLGTKRIEYEPQHGTSLFNANRELTN